jgi:hypothetical protein
MNYLVKVLLIMMLPLQVKLWLLVLLLVAMMLTPPTPSHLLLRLLCLLLLQLLMSSMRAFPMMRLSCLQGNFGWCTSFRRRGEETPEIPEVVLSAETPPTSAPTAPRGWSGSTLTRKTTTTRTTTRITTRKRIASGTGTGGTSRRSCPEHVPPWVKTHQVQKRMRRSTTRSRKMTSPGCASWPWEDLRGTTLNLTPILM